MNELAETLLRAHVQHELAQWQAPAFDALLQARVQKLFEWLGEVTLDQVATQAQVMAAIRRYVIDGVPSGALAELAGEMSQLVFSSTASAETLLCEILDQPTYDEFASKLSGLERVRSKLAAIIARSDALHAARAALLVQALRERLDKDAATEPARFAEASRDWVAKRVWPWLERRVAPVMARYPSPRQRSRMARRLERLSNEHVRAVLDDVWAAVASMRLSEAFALIGEQDLEDFVVLGYEFWRRYRKSAYFSRITELQVAHFFDKYGALSVRALIDDLGVTEAMVCEELREFVRPLLQLAADSGELERLIRARLERFYHSDRANALLGA
jgi:hypothetical protein